LTKARSGPGGKSTSRPAKRAAGRTPAAATCHHWCARQRRRGGGATSGHDEHRESQPGKPGETEPDIRFTLANERTFLAWNRTALALVVAGLGIVQLLPPFPRVPWGRHALGVPLIVLGAVVSVTAYLEWRRTQTALRRSEPMPQSVLPKILVGTITGVAALSAVVLLVSAIR
jgi:inner membrane protein YidH